MLSLGGSFNASALNVLDGTAFVSSVPSQAGGINSNLSVFFSDKTSLCSTGVRRQNETVLVIGAMSGGPAFQAGTFTDTQEEAPGQAYVSVTALNGACANQSLGAASGTVVITSVTSSAVSGTFDVTLLGDAGTLQGSFNVPLCDQAFSYSCQP
jgi:hypothetical protein